MQRIVFATNNEHKLREVRHILQGVVEIVSLADIGCTDDIPETATTIVGNALCKVRYVKEHYGYDCFADDTGLEVDALGGEPGIFTARYGALHGYGDDHDSDANTRCLLDNLRGASCRTARFRTAIALLLDGTETIFNGVVEGEITVAPIGTQGFGYDPVFRPLGYSGTFAEMGPDEKNRISHRALAIAQLRAFLSSRQG